MKIEDSPKREKVRYESLEVGEVFEYAEQIYMKTYEYLDSEINSVNLATTELETFNSYNMVVKLDAKLVIE